MALASNFVHEPTILEGNEGGPGRWLITQPPVTLHHYLMHHPKGDWWFSDTNKADLDTVDDAKIKYFTDLAHGVRMTKLEALIVDKGFVKHLYTSLPFCDLFDLANARGMLWPLPQHSVAEERRWLIKALQHNDRCRYPQLRWSLPELRLMCASRRDVHLHSNASKRECFTALIKADEARTFPRFLELPAELRLKIYKATINQATVRPKTLYRCEDGNEDCERPVCYCGQWRNWFDYKTSPLLHVSRRIHNEALPELSRYSPLMVWADIPYGPFLNVASLDDSSSEVPKCDAGPYRYQCSSYGNFEPSTWGRQDFRIVFDRGLPEAARDLFCDKTYESIEDFYKEVAKRYRFGLFSYQTVVEIALTVGNGDEMRWAERLWPGGDLYAASALLEKQGIRLPVPRLTASGRLPSGKEAAAAAKEGSWWSL